MPELPEVETIKNELRKYCLYRKIVSVNVNIAKLRYPVDPMLEKCLKYQIMCCFDRRGKHLLIYFNEYALILHFGMSGKLQIVNTDTYKSKKHDHIILNLDNTQTIVYHDPRKFGYCHLVKGDPLKHDCFINYGPEPLTQMFTVNYLMRILFLKKQAIKVVIMNNKIIVGIGNIYACESLFIAKINPKRAANSLTKNECRTLVESIKLTLLNAIKKGGTSLKDYKKIYGENGYFVQDLKVYGRKNKKCYTCGSHITSVIMNQRSTFYCPQCQK